MLKNHFKTAFRNLFRHKRNALIIILSLTVAFSFSNILLSFVIHELNTDGFHQHKNRIYRLHSNNPFEEGKQLWFVSREAVDFIQASFPEVEATTIFSSYTHEGIGPEELFPDVKVLDVDSTFFTLFDYQIIEGNPKTAIQLGGIVLTESTASKILKEQPYIGQSVEMALYDSTSRFFTITAIVADPLENTQIKFDALIMNNYAEKYWGGTACFLLNPKADAEKLVAKINQNKDVPSYTGRRGISKYALTPLQDAYFSEKGTRSYDLSRNKLLIWVCWGVVFLISSAASFNFINLFIISLVNRKKEIGVRKVLGASRSTLGLGLGIEVGLYILIALLLSVVFTIQLLPWFNLSFNTSLPVAYLMDEKVLFIIGGLVLLLGLLITMYLIYFSWRLNPISLLSNKVVEKISINRLLVGAQFFITMSMMVCAAVVIGQIQFIKNKPLGFNRDLMQLSARNSKKLPALKQKLLQYPEISSVAISSGNPISDNTTSRYDFEDGTFFTPHTISGDYDLIKTLHLEVIEGQPFSPGYNGVLVNETFVRHFNMKDPIGAPIPSTENYKHGPEIIIGVVKDFNTISFKQEIPPYIISYDVNLNHIFSLLIDISGKKLSTILPLVEKTCKEIYPDGTFRYKLIDDELMVQHKEDTLFFRMIISFTVASVLISCFGLFGIAAFTAVQRTKEIGVRKVLGASVSSILVLLSKDFVKLIFIAFILAIPVANYFMSEWLQNFAYKIDISWWMFMIPGLLVLCIALLSMLGQTLKAALANPVNSLRNE